MALQPLPLEGAELGFDPEWLPAGEAAALFAELRAAIPWEVHRIRLFGREVDSPRLSCWIGDPDATYRYSGVRFEPRPWSAALSGLRDRLERELGTGFNSVLANLYRDGRDAGSRRVVVIGRNSRSGHVERVDRWWCQPSVGRDLRRSYRAGP